MMYRVIRNTKMDCIEPKMSTSYDIDRFCPNKRSKQKLTRQPVDMLFGRSLWGMRTRNTNVPPPLQPPPSKSRTRALNGLVCSSIEMHTLVSRKGRRETPSSHAPRGQFFPNPFNRSPTKKAPTLLPISVPLSSSDHQPPSLLSNPISLSETSPPRRSHPPLQPQE